MAEFWEEHFRKSKEMWGDVPANSAVKAAELFFNNGYRNILIPGIGYGRNARPFLNRGMKVTGIEISKTAIELAEKHMGPSLTIHYGSVSDMPFDDLLYDGIFSHALIHLLDEPERLKLISDCYNQLSQHGLMVFTTITKQSHTYVHGTFISKDRYELFNGVKMFFHDEESIKRELSHSGLIEIEEVTENYPFYMITCRKE